MKPHITILGVLFFITNLLSAQNVLDSIEQKILTAYSTSTQTKTDQFQPIFSILKRIDDKDVFNTVNYWIAFTKYQQAKYLNSVDKEEKALEILKDGIKKLEALKSPTSEDLALQGAMVSFSIVFQKNLAAILGGKSSALFEKAAKKNKNNLRAYLGIGKSDFFKPIQYGGGFKVESYLKQALTKPDKSTEDDFVATWGRDQVYYYLVRFLKRENRIDEAKLYCNQGLKKFPNSSFLKSLLETLK